MKQTQLCNINNEKNAHIRADINSLFSESVLSGRAFPSICRVLCVRCWHFFCGFSHGKFHLLNAMLFTLQFVHSLWEFLYAKVSKCIWHMYIHHTKWGYTPQEQKKKCIGRYDRKVNFTSTHFQNRISTFSFRTRIKRHNSSSKTVRIQLIP